MIPRQEQEPTKAQLEQDQGRILDSVGASLRATGPGGRIMPTRCDIEKKSGAETCKRASRKGSRFRRSSCQGHAGFMTILNVRVEGDREELWRSYTSWWVFTRSSAFSAALPCDWHLVLTP